MLPFRSSLSVATLVAWMVCGSAQAETITRLDFDGASPAGDFAFTGAELATVDDGVAGTVGDQESKIEFESFLDLVPDVLVGGSVSFTGITFTGAPIVNGTVVLQETLGGTFSLFDAGNSLLLSGDVGTAFLSGSTVTGSGSFFSASPVTFTGGSLLPLIVPDSGALSFSMSSITTAGSPGLVVNGGAIQNFTADFNGQIEGLPRAAAVPEPGHWLMFLLLGTLWLGYSRRNLLGDWKRLVAPVAVLACVGTVSAGTIIRHNFEPQMATNAPDVSFQAGELRTIPEMGILPGDQSGSLLFDSFLDSVFADIDNVASVTLRDVMVAGPAMSFGPLISQATTGGVVEIFDHLNNLVLSAEIQSGLINGVAGQSTGSFVNTSPIKYTGGYVRPLILGKGDLSFSFTDIQSGMLTGLVNNGGMLANFQADTTALFTAKPVPEPLSLSIFGGVLALGLRRRTKASKVA